MSSSDFFEGFFRSRSGQMALFGDRMEENLLERGASGQFGELLFECNTAVVDDHDFVADL